MRTSVSEVDPIKLAKQQHTLTGSIAIANLPRASKSLASDQGDVSYTLGFELDDEHRCVIRGQLQAKYAAKCQRCLQLVVQDIESTFTMSPIRHDSEAKNLPEDYEPVIVTDNKLNTIELIEDELILAMPIVPMHELGATDCVAIESKDLQEPNNPFQVLQNLKVGREGHKAGDK